MIHHRLFTSLLAVLVWTTQPTLAAEAGKHDVSKDFVGQAHIIVLSNSNLSSASPKDRIGCLNANGFLTADDCAVFTRVQNAPLYSGAGNCSFQNANMPTNPDSIYGKYTHAWSCGSRETEDEEAKEVYYTVNGFNYPFICNGNLNCYYDILDAPLAGGKNALPVWQFRWGSEQFDVPAGHSRVTWLWQRV